MPLPSSALSLGPPRPFQPRAGLRRRHHHPRGAPQPKLLANLGSQIPVLAGWDTRMLTEISVHRETQPERVGTPDSNFLVGENRKATCLRSCSETKTDVSGLPVRSLSLFCNSQPCLAPERPFPPHIPSPWTPGSRPLSPRVPRAFAIGVPQPLRASSAHAHGPPPRMRTALRASRDVSTKSRNGQSPPETWLLAKKGLAEQWPKLAVPSGCEDKLTGQSRGRRARAQSERTGSDASAMWLLLLPLAALLLLAVLGKVCKGLFSSSSPNPFSEDVKRPPAPLVTDNEARKKVLKQGEREGPRGLRLRLDILAG